MSVKWHPAWEEISFLFNYDASRGVLIWKNAPEPNKKRLNGKVAGTIDKNGYLIVMIKKQCFKVHRVIWFWEHDQWPEIIDHINGDPRDNRIENLRDVDHTANMRNTYRHRGETERRVIA